VEQHDSVLRIHVPNANQPQTVSTLEVDMNNYNKAMQYLFEGFIKFSLHSLKKKLESSQQFFSKKRGRDLNYII